MIRPAYLKKGATVAIVSSARKISRKDLQPALELLNKWQLKVIVGKTVDASQDQFAGSDAERANDFQNVLDDPSISAIWCARGGYGTVRIIDQLDFTKFLKNPKWIIGYSDITVLHSALHKMNCESLHATMPINIGKNSIDCTTSLKKALFGSKIDYVIPTHSFNRLGKAEAQMIGGNLSILYSLLGSSSAIDPHGKILFIEDLDEYLYHIDRMLMNLKRNRWFDGLAGLILGGMTQMNDNEIPFGKNALEIIRDIVAEYDFPVAFGFPAGHIDDNRALIMGRQAKLEVYDAYTGLRFED